MTWLVYQSLAGRWMGRKPKPSGDGSSSSRKTRTPSERARAERLPRTAMSTSRNRPATASPDTPTESADVVPISPRSRSRTDRPARSNPVDSAVRQLHSSPGDLEDQLTHIAQLMEDLAEQVEDDIDFAARVWRVSQLCRGLAGWARRSEG